MALAALGVLIGLPVGLVGWSELRYARGKTRAEQAWRDERPSKLEAFGSTRSLAILPLVDWFSARPELQCEAGVSYLIKTDANTILMDVGLNLAGTDPSPLLHNMRELGISLEEIDTIVLSHCHADHVGGLRWLRRHTLSLGNVQLDLRGKRVFAPEPLTYPGISPQCSRVPTVIGRGVATIGAIRAQIYLGRVDEQALAIRVSGKGIVLVVGCGHQSLPKILARARQLFDDPIYGSSAGCTTRCRAVVCSSSVWTFRTSSSTGRSITLGKQRWMATSRSWRATPHDWVSLSAHDSSDEVIDDFRRVFGAAYHDLLVGDWQTVAAGTPQEDASLGFNLGGSVSVTV
jgi:7,8-dihydropterin-6-yl-methyl-4-(beta-D-ribofuranosyl)aminobenzene 5'-phosphate synthase